MANVQGDTAASILPPLGSEAAALSLSDKHALRDWAATAVEENGTLRLEQVRNFKVHGNSLMTFVVRDLNVSALSAMKLADSIAFEIKDNWPDIYLYPPWASNDIRISAVQKLLNGEDDHWKIADGTVVWDPRTPMTNRNEQHVRVYMLDTGVGSSQDLIVTVEFEEPFTDASEQRPEMVIRIPEMQEEGIHGGITRITEGARSLLRDKRHY